MVLTESIKNIEANDCKEKEPNESEKIERKSAKKLLSCEEFERSIGLQLKGNFYLYLT